MREPEKENGKKRLFGDKSDPRGTLAAAEAFKRQMDELEAEGVNQQST